MRSADQSVIDCLFKASGEAPLARFSWIPLGEVMAKKGDWPNCFAASINALRGRAALSSLVHIEPLTKVDPLHLLEASGKELNISLLTIEALSSNKGFRD